MNESEQLFVDHIKKIQDELDQHGLVMVDFEYTFAPYHTDMNTMEKVREYFINGQVSITIKVTAIIDDWDFNNQNAIDYSNFQELYGRKETS